MAPPHSSTLFLLMPKNPRAEDVLNHPENSHLVAWDPDEQKWGISVGAHIGSSSRYTLATLGRTGADIVVEGAIISRIQCSFEYHPESGQVMLYDHSNAQTTQLLGHDAFPFETGRIRRVVVARKINGLFGMGGLGCDHVQFRLLWQPGFLQVSEDYFNHRVDPPRLARTIDEAPTVLPSGRTTRIHIPGDARLKLRVNPGEKLGTGQFGSVRKALDVDSGKMLAVKSIKRSAGGMDWLLLKREVKTLARISHVGTQTPSFIPCLISNSLVL